MGEKKQSASVATLIGDIVGSRVSADRAVVHDRLEEALDRANRELGPLVELRITAGDECQGSFATVGEALRATSWLRRELTPEVELRYGVGWGPVTQLADEPRIEDGPGWWVARDAIEAVKADAGRSGLRHLRTAYRRGAEVAGPDPDPINAALLCRDHLVGSLPERSQRILAGLARGLSQAEIARDEGISSSAVSQRVRGDGLAAILAADELLEGVR